MHPKVEDNISTHFNDVTKFPGKCFQYISTLDTMKSMDKQSVSLMDQIANIVWLVTIRYLLQLAFLLLLPQVNQRQNRNK